VNLQIEIRSPPVMSGRGRSNSSDEAEDVVRRRAEAPACRRATTAAFLLCSLVRQRSARDKGNGGRRRWCGVKRRSLPPPPYLYVTGKGRGGRGGRGKCSTTPTVSERSRHVVARSGAAVPVTEPLGNDGMQ
jgi:hypothetical protein